MNVNFVKGNSWLFAKILSLKIFCSAKKTSLFVSDAYVRNGFGRICKKCMPVKKKGEFL
jgi:hypothetical protein